jgi:uncharacterized protein (TIGR02679 family)
LIALLEAYTKRPVIRRVGSRVTVNAFSAYVDNELLIKYKNTEAEGWLGEVVAHTRRVYRRWAEAFIRDPQLVASRMEAVCNALNDLPCLHDKYESLPDFTKRLDNDIFDLGLNGECGSLLLKALARRFDVPLPTNAEDGSALYFMAGLLTEGVLNQASVRGVLAFCGEASDPVCDFYNQRGEPHVLTLQHLSRFSHTRAHKKIIYVLENRAVFSAVSELLPPTCPCTMLCMDNGFNAAASRLLDMLTASGAKIRYSGDMDYKGLTLADKIYLRYPKQFDPWRLDKDEYERVMSDSEFHLTEQKKEQGLHHEGLASLLSYMHKKGKAAWQISLVKELAQDIRDRVD